MVEVAGRPRRGQEIFISGVALEFAAVPEFPAAAAAAAAGNEWRCDSAALRGGGGDS